jgi:ubiquinone/menaquinone biosynthesis C-methylase UbiE
MKRVDFSQAKNDSHLITTVNKVFHDIEAESYVDRHPEIYEYEATQWRELLLPLLLDYRAERQDGITLLDIGTGIGFVPASISTLLSARDTVVFSDISNGMLQKADEYCKKYSFNKVFTVVDEQYSQIADASIDIVTLNSVLHHIATPQVLFTQIDRVLRPGGIVIVKHEPNILFGESLILRNIYALLKMIRPAGKSVKVADSLDDVLLKQVATKLRDEENIEFIPALTKLELQQIVDIHSPTAGGGLDLERGFNPLQFCIVHFRTYKMLRMKTYGYFGKIRDDKNFIRKICSIVLKTMLPNRGYFFDIVIKKNY